MLEIELEFIILPLYDFFLIIYNVLRPNFGKNWLKIAQIHFFHHKFIFYALAFTFFMIIVVLE